MAITGLIERADTETALTVPITAAVWVTVRESVRPNGTLLSLVSVIEGRLASYLKHSCIFK